MCRALFLWFAFAGSALCSSNNFTHPAWLFAHAIIRYPVRFSLLASTQLEHTLVVLVPTSAAQCKGVAFST